MVFFIEFRLKMFLKCNDKSLLDQNESVCITIPDWKTKQRIPPRIGICGMNLSGVRLG